MEAYKSLEIVRGVRYVGAVAGVGDYTNVSNNARGEEEGDVDGSGIA